MMDSGFGGRENREDVFRGYGRFQKLQGASVEDARQAGEAMEMGTVVGRAQQKKERATFAVVGPEVHR